LILERKGSNIVGTKENIRWLNNLRVFFKDEINEEADNRTIDEIIRRLKEDEEYIEYLELDGRERD